MIDCCPDAAKTFSSFVASAFRIRMAATMQKSCPVNRHAVNGRKLLGVIEFVSLRSAISRVVSRLQAIRSDFTFLQSMTLNHSIAKA